jgi:hypothetical protein
MSQGSPGVRLAPVAQRAALLCLGAVCVGALVVWRPSSSDAAALAGESAGSAPLPPSPSQLAAPVAAERAPAADGLESSPPGALGPPERARLAKLAVDALAAGDRRSAAAYYQELALLSPEDPTFVAAAQILARRIVGSR